MPEDQWTTIDGIRVKIGNEPWVDQGGIRVKNPKYTSGPQMEGPPGSKTVTNPSGFGDDIEKSSTLDKVIEFLRPSGIAPAVATGVRVAGAFPGPPMLKAGAGALAGTGTYLGLDTALQKFRDKPPVDLNESLTSSVSQLALNEALTRGSSVLLRGAKELIKPGSVINNSITKLNPTYSQLKTVVTGQKAEIADWLERTFSKGGFASSQVRSNQLGRDEVESLAQDIVNSVGISPSNIKNPESLADTIRSYATINLDRIQQESNVKALTVKAIAMSRPILVPSTAPPPLVNPGPDQVLSNGQWNRVVRGPIYGSGAIVNAYQLLKNKQEFWGSLTNAQGEDKELVQLAQGILKRTEATPDGRHLPMSFEEAWDYKQQLSKFAYAKRIEGDISHQQGVVGKLSQALDEDIERSIKNWPARGSASNPSTTNQAALESYRSAKAIVALRFNIFGKDGIKSLVNETNSAIPQIDSYINDPKLLQKVLNAGEITLPNPAGGPGGPLAPTKILSTNMRRDLGGYQLMKIMQDSMEINPIDPTKSRIDIGKMQNSLNDPKLQDSYKLLFNSRERSDIDQLFKNIAITQEKGGTMGKVRVYLGHGGLAIPAALLTGHVTNYAVAGAVGGTVGLSGFALARVMQDPRIARALVAMSSGQPAGLSDLALGRAITGILQGSGTVVNMIGQDGSSTKGTIGKDSSWVSQ